MNEKLDSELIGKLHRVAPKEVRDYTVKEILYLIQHYAINLPNLEASQENTTRIKRGLSYVKQEGILELLLYLKRMTGVKDDL